MHVQGHAGSAGRRPDRWWPAGAKVLNFSRVVGGWVEQLEVTHRGDQEGLGRFGGGGAAIALVDGGIHQHILLGLDDLDAPGVDGIDGVMGEIDADDLFLARGEERGGGEADVAEADHGDAVEHGCQSFIASDALTMDVGILGLSGFTMTDCLAGETRMSMSSMGTAPSRTSSPSTSAPVKQPRF